MSDDVDLYAYVGNNPIIYKDITGNAKMLVLYMYSSNNRQSMQVIDKGMNLVETYSKEH